MSSAIHDDPEDARLASLLRSQFFILDVTATGPGRWTVGVTADELGVAEDVATAARAIAGRTPIKLVDNEYRLAFNRHVAQMRAAVERFGVRCEDACFVPRPSLDDVLAGVAAVSRSWQSWLDCHDLPGMVRGVHEEVERLAEALGRVAEANAVHDGRAGWERWEAWRRDLGLPSGMTAVAAVPLIDTIVGSAEAQNGRMAVEALAARWAETRSWLQVRGLSDVGADRALVGERIGAFAQRCGEEAAEQLLSKIGGRIPEEEALRQASMREKVRRVPFLQDVSDLDDLAAAAIRRSEARGLEQFKCDLPRILSERLVDVLSSVLTRASPGDLTGKTRTWVRRTAEWVREFNVTGDCYIDRCADTLLALDGPTPPARARLELFLRSFTTMVDLLDRGVGMPAGVEPPGVITSGSRGLAVPVASEQRTAPAVELELDLT